jgi:hypothetical protein
MLLLLGRAVTWHWGCGRNLSAVDEIVVIPLSAMVYKVVAVVTVGRSSEGL